MPWSDKRRPLAGRLVTSGCKPGEYPWDDWFTAARAADVPEDLAQLGRSLVREADQHSWSEALQALCGWKDDGAAMIRAALDRPDDAREIWQHLMDSDGFRGHWREGGDYEEHMRDPASCDRCTAILNRLVRLYPSMSIDHS